MLEAMCNPYSIKTSRAALARKLHLPDNRMLAFDALPAISAGRSNPQSDASNEMQATPRNMTTSLPQRREHVNAFRKWAATASSSEQSQRGVRSLTGSRQNQRALSFQRTESGEDAS